MKNEKPFEYSQNNNPFDFENLQPPILREATLRQENERRTLKRQIRILRISSVLTAICLALFAFFIAPVSMLLAIVITVVLCVSMIGYGVIGVLFYKNGYSSFEL